MSTKSTFETMSESSTGELSDNHLDAVSGGFDVVGSVGQCAKAVVSGGDGGGGDGLASFLAGFVHGLTSH
jgi:hypothetical protein